MAIRTFKHKGLNRLYSKDDSRALKPDWVDRLSDMLFALDNAKNVEELSLIPGWRLHPLKGDLRGYWSLTVSKNWRLVFRFDDGDAFDLDLIDYH